MTTPPFEDTQDFTDADRGLVDRLDPAVVRAADGRVVWDNDAYDFLRQDCPPSANPSLERSWALRGYYGSVSHNVKAVYQRYMGWYDGNPANLWPHPPREQAVRYVDCLGGLDATVARARAYADAEDLRFAATLLNHAVFADPGHRPARELLAEVYQRLGHGAENGPWRNFYLTAAMELRGTPAPVRVGMGSDDLVSALTVDQLLDSVAIRINGPRAWDTPVTIDLHLTDLGRGWRLTLSNGALTHRSAPAGRALGPGEPDLALTLTKPQLLAAIAGQGLDGIDQQGDPKALAALLSFVDTPDPNFPIVTP